MLELDCKTYRLVISIYNPVFSVIDAMLNSGKTALSISQALQEKFDIDISDGLGLISSYCED